MFLRQTLTVLVRVAQHGNGLCAETVSYEEFLEVQLEHFLADDAANGDGCGVLQCNAQEATTGDIAVASNLAEELQHGEVLRIMLILVEKHQCVVTTRQPVASNHAKGKVEVLFLVDVLEQLVAFIVLNKVYLHIIRIKSSTHLTDAERLANLTGSLQYQNLVSIRL